MRERSLKAPCPCTRDFKMILSVGVRPRVMITIRLLIRSWLTGGHGSLEAYINEGILPEISVGLAKECRYGRDLRRDPEGKTRCKEIVQSQIPVPEACVGRIIDRVGEAAEDTGARKIEVESDSLKLVKARRYPQPHEANPPNFTSFLARKLSLSILDQPLKQSGHGVSLHALYLSSKPILQLIFPLLLLPKVPHFPNQKAIVTFLNEHHHKAKTTLESEHLHRQAYNDAFAHFNVRCPPSSQPLSWDIDFYDVLQNLIGGGKPKMRWYFKEHGWPSSTIFETPSESDEERAKLIDTLQDWKTERYKEIIKSGTVEPRPGVLRFLDEAKAAGKMLAVCSAATKSSVVLVLRTLSEWYVLVVICTQLARYCLLRLTNLRVLSHKRHHLRGKTERFGGLDCFLAGDDVKEKKPDPLIYLTSAKRLGVSEKDCLVVEDSVIGLQAATKAGMSCVITYTSSTADQVKSRSDNNSLWYSDSSFFLKHYRPMRFYRFYSNDLSKVRLSDLELLLQNVVAAN
ncbi:Haloacid dehalogenase-like hydrolase domain-containing protein [Hibiscus syriacus]|uniref:Haloacid dehalogenase-like hydrolase domain-containing protein n=1 Tax=Hibiscus syriacus TaxID=106335 RepID=A0A6A3AQK0_HIBSY|nr:Haloacid dehalogenase-like hydrolase domain-containing protein [Hibiscus syriacus]